MSLLNPEYNLSNVDSINKYAFIGTHGVGKTTLVSYVDFYFRQLSQIPQIIPEAARFAKGRGLLINEETTLKAQNILLSIQMDNEFIAKNNFLNGEINQIICDRSVIDNYVYALYKFGKKAKDSMYDYVLLWLEENPYKKIFKIPLWNINENLTNDNFRSLDKKFQIGIDKLLDNILIESNVEYVILPKELFSLDYKLNPDLQTANLRKYFDKEFGTKRKSVL